MSDNYKVIRKAKEAALELKSKGWTNNGIIKEIGISFALLTEILEYDPVSVNVRDVTMEKLRDFIDNFAKGIDKPLRKSSRPEKSQVKKDPADKPEFNTVVPESMAEAIPEETGIIRGPRDLDGNLLNDLNNLAKRFASQGYRLSASIELTYEP